MLIIKVGGSAGIDYDAVCDDIATLSTGGRPIILIHGGSQRTNEVATALGHPPRFITSPSGYTSRLTDKRTLEIFEMVYCGQMNKMIVEKLQQRGINALGLSGLDGRLWQGTRKKVLRAVENGRQRIIRDSYTGKVTQVNDDLLHQLLDAGFLPVLCPPAISEAGEAINVDGDRAAAATAATLQAEQLIILSNTPGVLRHFPDEGSLIAHIDAGEIESMSRQVAEGRMRIKLLGAQEALRGGVTRVVLGDARCAQPVQRAMQGQGTVIS